VRLRRARERGSDHDDRRRARKTYMHMHMLNLACVRRVRLGSAEESRRGNRPNVWCKRRRQARGVAQPWAGNKVETSVAHRQTDRQTGGDDMRAHTHTQRTIEARMGRGLMTGNAKEQTQKSGTILAVIPCDRTRCITETASLILQRMTGWDDVPSR
jgi:hypothetical protein